MKIPMRRLSRPYGTRPKYLRVGILFQTRRRHTCLPLDIELTAMGSTGSDCHGHMIYGIRGIFVPFSICVQAKMY